MASSALKVLAFTTIVFIGAGSASAQMIPAPVPHVQSLELSAINSSVVVTGSLVDYGKRIAGWHVTIAVKDRLKGDPSDRVTVTLPTERLVIDQQQLDAWKQTAALLLVTIPSGPQGPPSIIDLSDPALAVMTADLKLLRTPAEVIQVVMDVIRRTPGAGPVDAFGILAPQENVAAMRLPPAYNYPRGFVTVDVPVGASLEILAHAGLRSAAPRVRVNGAQALRHFKSAENIELLKPLLTDPAWENSYAYRDNKILRTQHNDVRREAYLTLRVLGADVGEPGFTRPSSFEEQVVSVALDTGTVTDAEISDLTRYPNLEDLYLSNQSLTERQWTVVSALPSLQTLFLEGSNVSDAVVEGLSRLPNLVYLGLGNTAVTDRGLRALTTFRGLKKVDLGPRVTTGGVATLQAARPDLQVRMDEFAFLQPLSPTRIEVPFGQMRNWNVAEAYQEAAGLRVYVLLFPARTAGQVDEVLERELPKRGWTYSDPPGRYRRNGIPIVGTYGSYSVDEVVTNRVLVGSYARQTAGPGPGERLIVIRWNVAPR